ncbi:MAG TPA: prolyl oligopeptidase family serine peptidase [Gemmatimonadaceae bacterium]
MRRSWIGVLLSTAVFTTGIAAQTASSVAPFISPGFPSDLVSAKKADRIAWLVYERGMRNVYAAAAPDFKPVRLTKFLDDDGVILSDLEISDDGSIVTFTRGSEPNREGWIANPSSNPNGPERAIWAAKTNGAGAWKLTQGDAGALSPDGASVAFAKDGQIFRVRTAQSAPAAPSSPDKADQPLIKEWGRNTTPRWSPDGSRLAFVSARENHSYVAVYDMKSRRVTYLAPGVDFDLSPTWSSDSKRVAFIRRPGTPFGQQAQPGVGGIGGPSGPAVGRGRGNAGRGGGLGNDTVRADGLYRAVFKGGYSLSLMVADATTGEGHEFWHNQPNDKTFPNINAITWAGDHIIFAQEPEEWIRFYSVNPAGGTTTPVELTPGTGAVESLGLSSDGKTMFYATNVGDIDRRHVWRVPTAGGPAVQITTGSEIEMYPAALASGKQIAVLTSTATRPMSVGVVSLDGGAKRLVYPALTKDYLAVTQVAPEPIVLKAEDGVEFHNQLFLPKDLKPGERRPAVVFVHGGPIRQMLLGYHYMDFYHMAYAVNEWLASQGYIVMSVNYRSGIGYGKSFRTAPNTGGRGNAEYRDVLAAGKYLETRADVDPTRIGIWGLSYGGVLTAQALARNSDIFAAGVDMAGVHLWGNSLDTSSVSYKSSAISAIDQWKSPVLVWQNDDDRNVDFSQTIGLVDLLRTHDVHFELIVNPDDTHETLMHSRWLYLFGRMQDFFSRFLRDKNVSSSR